MVISNNSYVVFHYDLMDDQGNLVESSRKGEPSEYIAGSGYIIPRLEETMLGKNDQDSFTVTVSPQDGYGFRDDSMVFPVPIELLTKNLPQSKVGDVVMMQNGGNPIRATITAIDAEKVTLDANHPLAGKTLTFKIDIVSVREATAEEIESQHHHGHSDCSCDHNH